MLAASYAQLHDVFAGDFFGRKRRILFLTLMTYAAMC